MHHLGHVCDLSCSLSIETVLHKLYLKIQQQPTMGHGKVEQSAVLSLFPCFDLGGFACNFRGQSFVIRNLSILQLRITQIKLLLAIWVIGHFLYIRMYYQVLCSPRGNNQTHSATWLTVTQSCWALAPMSHCTGYDLSCSPTAPSPFPGGPAPQQVSDQLLPACRPANNLPVSIQTDYSSSLSAQPLRIAHL